MSRTASLLVACALFPLLACSEPEKKEGGATPVRAVVWQVWVVEGAMDMIHGGGRWIREIHLPGANISFNVEEDRLNCFVPEATRYAAPGEVSDAHAPRQLGEIEVAETFVTSLQQLLKQRDEAREAAKAYFSTAPPLQK